jgi:chromosome segregation ATPase
MKIAIVILTVVTLGLGAGLFIQHHQSSMVVRAAEISRDSFSNSWIQTKVKLEESDKVANTLETKLNLSTEALVTASNELAKTTADLTRNAADLAKVQTDYSAAQAEMKKQQAQIAQLETQRDDLTKKMDELTTSIASLETRIDDTKKKLASSEGDRTFLLKELTRLQSEKATLVAQFNNLSALRTQVAKLREEAAINQRLAWTQMGVYSQREKKGAERLVAATPNSPKGDGRLDVEVEQNGRSKIVPESNTTPNNP